MFNSLQIPFQVSSPQYLIIAEYNEVDLLVFLVNLVAWNHWFIDISSLSHDQCRVLWRKQVLGIV